MNAVLLGSGGWIPTSRRETCCAYLRRDDHVLLIDAGTGVQRLVEEPALLDGAKRLDIVLTHFHLDHVVGLGYLPGLPLRATVWGPGERLYGSSTAAILGRLLDPPLFPVGLDEMADDVRELAADTSELGRFELRIRNQLLHSHPTLALRIGDELTYCTDTAVDPGNAELAAGSRLLLHEAWYATDATDDQTHTAAGEAGRLAADAGVHELVLIHVNPQLSSEAALAEAARAHFRSASVGVDLANLGPLEGPL